MKQLVILLGMITCIAFTDVKAQKIGADYHNALGVKFYPGAVTYKHLFNRHDAIEALGYTWRYGGRITGLYEYHMDIIPSQGFRWYAGGGAHIGFYNDRYGGETTPGIDGVIGLDYKIPPAPINMSLDWQPSVEFNGYRDGFEGGFVGFSIRFAFN